MHVTFCNLAASPLLLHLFNGSTTWVGWYQKGKTSLGLNEAKVDGGFLEAVASAGPYIYIQIYIAPKIMGKNLRCWKFWWYFGDHMQIICTLLLIDNHTNTSLLFCSISDLEIFLTLFISSSPGFIQKSSWSPLFQSAFNSPSSQAYSDLLMLSCFITFWWCNLQYFSYLPTYINYCNCALQCCALQCFDAVGWAAGRASGL